MTNETAPYVHGDASISIIYGKLRDRAEKAVATAEEIEASRPDVPGIGGYWRGKAENATKAMREIESAFPNVRAAL
jgi:hypothetical protein